MEYFYDEATKYEEIDLFEVYEDEPVYQPEPVEPAQPVKIKRVSHGTVEKRRPGRLPARPDDQLNEVELEQRERRRERNRHAAARCRSRRLQTVDHLQGQVDQLNKSKAKLHRENERLKAEVNKLKMMKCENSKSEQKNNVFDDDRFPALKQLDELQTNSDLAGVTLCLTPILLGQSFDFPMASDVVKIRNESFSEFIDFMNVV